MDQTIKLALDTIKINKQAIIFNPSRASAEKTAEDISKLTDLFHPELEKGVLHSISSPTKQCRRLSNCVKKGIAFHHSGLTSKQKEIVEESFKEGKIKIISATPTLAAGLSMPAFRVIIKSLKRYSGSWGMNWIPVLEYLQMAGRAGRPEYEAFGESIVIAKTEPERDEIVERYIKGVPEDIYSKLAAEPILRTYLLSLISSGLIRDEESMNNFFSKTFWAHQFKDMNKLQQIMEKMILLLEEWGFISIQGKEGVNSDFVSAQDLDNKSKSNKTMRPTLIGKRISELYLDPLTANHLINCLKNYDDKKEHFSLLQMISHTLEMRPLLRIKKKEEEIINEELTKNYHLLLEKEPSSFDIEYDEFFNSIKTSLFFGDWVDEKNEDYLLEKYNVRPGEIRSKIESANWLIYAAKELAKINGDNLVAHELRKLREMVKNGVREELLPLLKLKGIGRVRARKLFSHGMKDLGHLRRTDLTSLTQIVGKATAESVKIQLGEEIKVIPKGTRKGQLSMEKFK